MFPFKKSTRVEYVEDITGQQQEFTIVQGEFTQEQLSTFGIIMGCAFHNNVKGGSIIYADGIAGSHRDIVNYLKRKTKPFDGATIEALLPGFITSKGFFLYRIGARKLYEKFCKDTGIAIPEACISGLQSDHIEWPKTIKWLS